MNILIGLAFVLSANATSDRYAKFDWSCESALAPVPAGGRQVFAGLIRLPSGGELFTRIEEPRGGPRRGWVFLIHGLLDSHRSFDELTRRLISLGYGVARPDLRGFARSLHDRHRTYGTIDYREHVRDLHELIGLLRLRYHVLRPRLVGHSMGAGLQMALLAQPGIAAELDSRHVIANPYVYRTEFYLAKKLYLSSLTSIDPWIPSILKMVPQMMADSVIDPQMRHGFAAYLRTARQVQGLDLNEYRVRRAIEDQVEVAIGTVRGLRRLNSLHEIEKIPAELKIDMAYGDRDDVVEPPLARELARRIAARGGRVVEMHAQHHIPTDQVDEFLKLVVN